MIVMSAVTGIMFILTCLSVAGIITFSENRNIGIFLCVIFGAFCAVQLICLFTTRPSIKKIGFYIFHIGLVVFLFGNFMFFVSGEKISVNGVEVGNVAYNKIKSADGDDIELGFGIQAKKFDVVKYNADESGMAADKFLNALIVIYPDSGDSYEKSLYVNGPVTVNGWKMYLMGYNTDDSGDTTLSLTFKKNPGEIPTIAAIVLMIIGSFVMAFGKTALPASAANSGKNPKKKPQTEGGGSK